MPRGVQSSEVPAAVQADAPRRLMVERFVAERGVDLMRFARSHSANAADADDAYQCTLEAMLTKAPLTDDQERLMAWAATVARNEARMQHRRRKRMLDDSFESISEQWVDTPASPDELLVDAEQLKRTREALLRLDPEQTRLLLLRADGHGYADICSLTGFSYAKVNRLLCEARKSFRARIERLESGAECRRIENTLSMIADGEADGEARADAERHLRDCLACQATLREFSVAPRRAAALLPLGALASPAGGDWIGRAAEFFQSIGVSVQERAAAFGAGAGQGAELAFAKKAVVATAITATIVAGGAGVEKVIAEDPAGPAPMNLPTPDLPPSGTTGASGGDGAAGPTTSATEAPRDATERDFTGEDPVVRPAPAPELEPQAEVAPSPEESAPPPGSGTTQAPSAGNGVSP